MHSNLCKKKIYTRCENKSAQLNAIRVKSFFFDKNENEMNKKINSNAMRVEPALEYARSMTTIKFISAIKLILTVEMKNRYGK